MNKIIYLMLWALISSVMLISDAVAERSVMAQLVWHELSDTEHFIYLSDYDGENWSDFIVLHESENAVSSAVLATSRDGDKLLVWTELLDGKSILMHKFYSDDAGEWGQSTLLTEHGYENIGATIVYDIADKAWLFWGANDNDLSDVVGMTFSDGEWSDVFSVHPDNNVPDIHPRASLDNNGDVLVKWSSYSFDERQYVELSQKIETHSNQQQDLLPDDSVEYADISLPDFLPSNARSLIHFPRNLMVQSEYYVPLPEPLDSNQ